MPFIGNQPALSYTSFAKQDFSTSATTSYTLDNPVTNANELALFINFVRQEPTTAYSASGTTLTLTSATSASDDMYCVYLGKAVQTVNPPNASVGTSQLIDGSVTNAKLSGVTQGITNAQSFQLTSAVTLSGNPAFITTNIGTNAVNTYANKGTLVSQSSGVFSFSATGYYLVTFHATLDAETTPDTFSVEIQTTNDNSNYNIASVIYLEKPSNSNDRSGSMLNALVNVDNTSNVKVKFSLGSANAVSSCIVSGSATDPRTTFNFIRLGDSV